LSRRFWRGVGKTQNPEQNDTNFFFVHAILICYFRFQISEIRHIFEGFMNYLNTTVPCCILATTHAHKILLLLAPKRECDIYLFPEFTLRNTVWRSDKQILKKGKLCKLSKNQFHVLHVSIISQCYVYVTLMVQVTNSSSGGRKC